jgi:hypothetical protein
MPTAKSKTTSIHLRDLYRATTPTQKLAVVARLNATLIGLEEAELTCTSSAFIVRVAATTSSRHSGHALGQW